MIGVVIETLDAGSLQRRGQVGGGRLETDVCPAAFEQIPDMFAKRVAGIHDFDAPGGLPLWFVLRFTLR